MNNGPASVIGFPRPQRIFWRLSHISCVAPLGLHQGGWRRTTPLALHLTPLLPGSSEYPLITSWQPWPCQRGRVGSIKCSPKMCGGHVSPAHRDTGLGNVLGTAQGHWALTAFCWHSTESTAGAKSYRSSRRGTNRVRQGLWDSILH